MARPKERWDHDIIILATSCPSFWSYFRQGACGGLLAGLDAEGGLFQRFTPSSLPEAQFSVISRICRSHYGRTIITSHHDVGWIQNPIPKESSSQDEQVLRKAVFVL
jgi:hypothetical protein